LAFFSSPHIEHLWIFKLFGVCCDYLLFDFKINIVLRSKTSISTEAPNTKYIHKRHKSDQYFSVDITITWTIIMAAPFPAQSVDVSSREAAANRPTWQSAMAKAPSIQCKTSIMMAPA
jgi:hypothetical protein